MLELTCKSWLQSWVINDEIFEREIFLCNKLSSENWSKCWWWECDKCWVIPLLYKLNKWILVENKEEINKLRKDKLNQ